MKALLIYYTGDEYEQDVKVKEFESKEKLIKFVNYEGIGGDIMSAYEFYSEIEIEPFEKVISYKLKK